MGGRWSGISMRLSTMSVRRLSSGAAASETKACGAARALRFSSARPPRQRQMTSGDMPMMEYLPRAAPPSMLSSRNESGRPEASFM